MMAAIRAGIALTGVGAGWMTAALLALAVVACEGPKGGAPGPAAATLEPVLVTEKVKHDTDDPAIWRHPTDRTQSLVIGTDKDEDGALFVFGLDGRIIQEKSIRGLQRPNNVD